MTATKENYQMQWVRDADTPVPALDFVFVFGVKDEIEVVGHAGTWLVAPAQLLVLVRTTGLQLRVPPDAAGYVFGFDEAFFSTDALNKRLLLDSSLLQQTPAAVLSLVLTRWKAISRLLWLLEQEKTGGAPDAEVIRSLARVLLLKLADGSVSPPPSSANHALLLRFQALLSQKYYQLPGAEAYAEALGVSARHLNHAVRMTTGKSTCDFTSGRLVAEAKRLLLHTEKSVKEVAFALGFADPYYFARYFKKHAHQSPGQYRKEQVLLSI